MTADIDVYRIRVLINPEIQFSAKLTADVLAAAIVAFKLPKGTNDLRVVFDITDKTITAAVRRGDEELLSAAGESQSQAATRLLDRLIILCATVDLEPGAKLQFGERDVLRAAPVAHVFDFQRMSWRVRRWPGGTQLRVEAESDEFGSWIWIFDADVSDDGELRVGRCQDGIESDIKWFSAIAGLVQFVMCDTELGAAKKKREEPTPSAEV